MKTTKTTIHSLALAATLLAPATAEAGLKWKLHDDRKKACGCTYLEPQGWGSLKKSEDGVFEYRSKDGVYRLKLDADAKTADEALQGEGALQGKTQAGDWTCAEGGGEDGQYEYVACARVVAGGVVTLLVSGSPETYSDLGGVEQVGKAAAALKGFPPKK